MNSRVCIIIINYCSAKDSISCIQSLLKSDFKDYKIILIDNASDDGSLASIKEWAANNCSDTKFIDKDEHESADAIAKLTIVAAQENRGFAAGNNIGIRLALNTEHPEYIWLLNNDTEVLPNTLSEYYNCAGKDNGEILGAKLFEYYDRNKIQAVGGRFNRYLMTSSHIGEGEMDEGQYDTGLRNLDYVIGASMFFTSAVFDRIGLLNEDYFLFFEELDICTRATKAGFSMGFCPNAIVYHKGGATIGGKGTHKSKLADYHGIRSKIIFIKTHYSGLRPMLYISLSASIVLRILRGKALRAKDVLYLMFSL